LAALAYLVENAWPSWSAVHLERSLAGGAAVAAAATLFAALADAPPAALVGIVVAGLGTSVCAPTLISLAARAAAPEDRGGAVGAVTTLAYLGFLVGPAAVGLAAGAAGLPAALGGVVGIAVLPALRARVAPVAQPAASITDRAASPPSRTA
jgi:MFS family permease